jgi:hypothetical protein
MESYFLMPLQPWPQQMWKSKPLGKEATDVFLEHKNEKQN